MTHQRPLAVDSGRAGWREGDRRVLYDRSAASPLVCPTAAAEERGRITVTLQARITRWTGHPLRHSPCTTCWPLDECSKMLLVLIASPSPVGLFVGARARWTAACTWLWSNQGRGIHSSGSIPVGVPKAGAWFPVAVVACWPTMLTANALTSIT